MLEASGGLGADADGKNASLFKREAQCIGLADFTGETGRFKRREFPVSVQCGGNRRSGLNLVDKTSGISWGCGAISTGLFGGVFMRDVILDSLLDSKNGAPDSYEKLLELAPGKHVIFTSEDGLQ